MNWNKWVRQIHRWLSIAFTIGVIVNLVAIALKSYADWVGLLAGLPLIFLLFTGLYLFVLPYAGSVDDLNRFVLFVARVQRTEPTQRLPDKPVTA